MPELELPYRLIALDLDGTLLNPQKELTEGNRRALLAAAGRGTHIVPTTGRFFEGMPEAVRSLPCIRYAITINGAQVQDRQTGEVLYRAEIPNRRAIEVMEQLDTLPVIYDCYMDNWGYMTETLYAQGPAYIQDPHVLKMLLELRKPVPELKAFLRETGRDVQKIQFFFPTVEERIRRLPQMQALFPDLNVCSALGNNVEINAPAANKGDALKALCRHLGLPVSQSLAFGDGLNDLSMIQAAGLGVAMENGDPVVKAAAGAIAPSCGEDGVGRFMETLLEQGLL